MKITKRGVTTKRHVHSYLVGGKWRTRNETVKLAEMGKVDGVIVCRRTNNAPYVQSLPNSGSRLSTLPMKVMN